MQIKECKICKKNTYKNGCRGFCKRHYENYRLGFLDIEGNLKNGFLFDENFYIIKIKNSLRNTIIESSWYREWRQLILRRDKKQCQKCGLNNIKLVIHHNKIRLSSIIREAKDLFPTMEDQLIYCKNRHTIDIGITLCKKCHAEEHKGEKMYASLSSINKTDTCLICKKLTYCKGFCRFHYSQYSYGIYNENGEQIKILRSQIIKNKCLVCDKIAKGKFGAAKNFCDYHHSQYHNQIIDINGNVLREYSIRSKTGKCKICNEKHSGYGFCYTHYNRYKLGQIDKDGNKIRELNETFKGGKKHNRKSIEFNGKKMYLDEWAKLLDININSLRKRLKKWSLEDALTKPKKNLI